MTITYHYSVTWVALGMQSFRDGLVFLSHPVDTPEEYDKPRALIAERYALDASVFTITSLAEMNRGGMTAWTREASLPRLSCPNCPTGRGDG